MTRGCTRLVKLVKLVKVNVHRVRSTLEGCDRCLLRMWPVSRTSWITGPRQTEQESNSVYSAACSISSRFASSLESRPYCIRVLTHATAAWRRARPTGDRNGLRLQPAGSHGNMYNTRIHTYVDATGLQLQKYETQDPPQAPNSSLTRTTRCWAVLSSRQ